MKKILLLILSLISLVGLSQSYYVFHSTTGQATLIDIKLQHSIDSLNDSLQARINRKINIITNSAGYLYNNGSGTFSYQTPSAGSAAWGSLTGSISSQTDLSNALDGKASSSHSHPESEVTNLVTDLSNKAATNQTFYLGSTQIAINRSTGNLVLTGITSIDGSAASCTGNSATVTGLSVTSGKTLTVNNNLTFSGTDGSSLAIGTGGTLGTGAYATIANYALLNSPSFTTPTLGVASATSINKVTITAPTTSATLTLVTGSSLITSGAYAITLTSTGTTGLTLPIGGSLQVCNSASTLTAGATVTLTPVLQTNTWTLNVGTNATITLNSGTIPSSCVGQVFDLSITSTTTSCTITFGTNFKSQGTLVTGTTSGKIFNLHYKIVSTSQINERGRTTAM